MDLASETLHNLKFDSFYLRADFQLKSSLTLESPKTGLCSDYSRTIVSYYYYCTVQYTILNITTQWINSNIK